MGCNCGKKEKVIQNPKPIQEVVRTPQDLMAEQLNKELMEWKDEEHKKLLEELNNNIGIKL